ncbi:hypothetical protein PVL29_007347 [Vitis rotundifolia]|uniref:UDP-glucose/GDP-mannose dehydrogenase C-terminal domain-containing protein n=1 Tax=Vitis rotundifolia TaxID=103349 RepID=A0AA39DW26_VITRO|nr:hypothetical protein PVL29_007347 [Vitis rotundifolia]
MEPLSETRVRKKREFRSVQDVANLQEVESLAIHGAFRSGGHRASVPDMKDTVRAAHKHATTMPLFSHLSYPLSAGGYLGDVDAKPSGGVSLATAPIYEVRVKPSDTRGIPAIHVCKGLLWDKARDLIMNELDWNHPVYLQPMSPTTVKQMTMVWDAYSATEDAHGICILTEWDEFKTLDYKKIYDNMQKPALVFDGRNIVNAEKLRVIGFIVYSIVKP